MHFLLVPKCCNIFIVAISLVIMSQASFSNGDNSKLTEAVVEFVTGLIAYNPAAKRSARALLKTHVAMPYATSFHNISPSAKTR